MRTHPAFLRQGAGALLLDHMIAEARHLSLETGSGPAFEPALALYRSRGFTGGDPFADYERSDFSAVLSRPVGLARLKMTKSFFTPFT